jgi:predicted transcriptional regulator
MAVCQRIGIKIHPSVHHFPLEISSITNFIDMSYHLKQLFELDVIHKPIENTFLKTKPRYLKNNEKSVLYAMIKYPEASISALADATKLAKPTIINTKKRLIMQGFVQKRVIPNIKKLGYELFTFSHLKYKPNITNYTIGKIESLSKNFIFFVSGKTGAVAVNCCKNHECFQEMKNLIPEQIIHEATTLRTPLKNIMAPEILNLAPLTKRLLNLNVDY